MNNLIYIQSILTSYSTCNCNNTIMKKQTMTVISSNQYFISQIIASFFMKQLTKLKKISLYGQFAGVICMQWYNIILVCSRVVCRTKPIANLLKDFNHFIFLIISTFLRRFRKD